MGCSRPYVAPSRTVCRLRGRSYREEVLRRVERIVFFVDEVERAVAWYEQILAGQVDRSGLPTVVVGDVQLGFHPADGKTPQGLGGTVPYCGGVDSLDTVAKKLVEGGAAVCRGPLEIEDGRRICQIKDPFGNVFGLIGM